jgi:hypothetical protein
MAASLLELLQSIPDHRRAEGKRFDLATVLLFVIVGMIAGANSYRQMHEFIRVHRQRLNEAFGQSLRYAPSYTGLRGILEGVDPSALEAAFEPMRPRWRLRPQGRPRGNGSPSPSTARRCAGASTLSPTGRRRICCRLCAKPTGSCSAT